MPAGQGKLLIPEGVVELNAPAAAIVELINGKRTPADIAQELAEHFGASAANIVGDVESLLNDLAARQWIVLGEADQQRTTAAEQR
jgi:coenzyme PQQ biosynthesis protein PqqD